MQWNFNSNMLEEKEVEPRIFRGKRIYRNNFKSFRVLWDKVDQYFVDNIDNL